jgi:sec-independent protein translocase protein TatA
VKRKGPTVPSTGHAPCADGGYSHIVINGDALMFGMGIGELLVILVIVLIIFGAGKLPEIGEGLGRGVRNFRKAVKAPDEIDITPGKDEEKKTQV